MSYQGQPRGEPCSLMFGDREGGSVRRGMGGQLEAPSFLEKKKPQLIMNTGDNGLAEMEKGSSWRMP